MVKFWMLTLRIGRKAIGRTTHNASPRPKFLATKYQKSHVRFKDLQLFGGTAAFHHSYGPKSCSLYLQPVRSKTSNIINQTNENHISKDLRHVQEEKTYEWASVWHHLDDLYVAILFPKDFKFWTMKRHHHLAPFHFPASSNLQPKVISRLHGGERAERSTVASPARPHGRGLGQGGKWVGIEQTCRL